MQRVVVSFLLLTSLFCAVSFANEEQDVICGARISRDLRFAGVTAAQIDPAQQIVDALAREGLLYAITNQILESRNISPTHRANWKQLRLAFAHAPDYDDILNDVALHLLRELSLPQVPTTETATLRSAELGISAALYAHAATRIAIRSELDAQILVRAIDNNFQDSPKLLIQGVEKQHAYAWWKRDVKRTLLPVILLPGFYAKKSDLRTFLANLTPDLREAAGWLLLNNEIRPENSNVFVAFVRELEEITPNTLFIETAKLRIEQKITSQARRLERLGEQAQATLLERARALASARLATLLTRYESARDSILVIVARQQRNERAESRRAAQQAAESALPSPRVVELAVELTEKYNQLERESAEGGATESLRSEIAGLERQLGELSVNQASRLEIASRDNNYRQQVAAALGQWLNPIGTNNFSTEEANLRETFHRVVREWGSARLVRFIQSQVTIDFLHRVALADERLDNPDSDATFFSNLGSIVRSLPLNEEQALGLVMGTLALLHRDRSNGTPLLNEVARQNIIGACIHDNVVYRFPAFSREAVLRIHSMAERRLSSAEQNLLFNSSRWRAAMEGRYTASTLAARKSALEQQRDGLQAQVEEAQKALADAERAQAVPQ